MQRRTVSIATAVVLFAATAFAQNPSLRHLLTPKDEETRREDVHSAEQVGRTINRVGSAFERGDAQDLGDCLAERRIYLSLKARGDETGYYGRSQVKFIFAKLFRERKTDSFTYDPDDIEVTGDGARFRAEWSYTLLDEDEPVTEHLHFRLERSNDDWRVSEIQSQLR